MGLFDRTTKFEVHDDFRYRVVVKTAPGMFTEQDFIVSKSASKYMRYGTVAKSYNKDLEVLIYVSQHDETREEKMTLICKLVLRDHAKVILRSRPDGVATFEPVKGNAIARLSIVVKLREFGKKLKLFRKKEAGEDQDKN